MRSVNRLNQGLIAAIITTLPLLALLFFFKGPMEQPAQAQVLACSTFQILTDTPTTYLGQAGKLAQVNAGETALQFAPFSTVTTEQDNLTWSDGTAATVTSTINTSGANDVVWTYTDDTVNLSTGDLQVGGVGILLASRTLTAGVGLSGGGDLTSDRTFTFDATELGTITWGSGSGYTWTFDTGATDPTLDIASGQIMFEDNQLYIENPGGTQSYQVVAGAIGGDYVLNLPVITGADTLGVLGLAQTYTANKTFFVAGPAVYMQNTTDAASNLVAQFSGGDRAVAADNDESYISYRLENDGGTQTEFVRFTWKALDVSDASKDSRPELQYYTNSVLRSLNFPPITGDDTIVTAGFSQTLAAKTLNSTNKIESGVEIAGGLTWNAAQNFNSQNLTNIDINSGAIDNVILGGAVQVVVTDADINGGTLAGVTVDGGLTWSAAQNLNAQILTNVNIDSGSINGVNTRAPNGTVSFPSISFTGDTDTGLYWQDIDRLGIAVNGTRIVDILPTQITYTDGITHHVGASAIQLTEMVAPSAGAVNRVKIYAVDNLGKTNLNVIFNTGVAQVIAAEPTTPTDAVVAAPDESLGTLILKRPHPGKVQLVARIPGFGDWVITEYQIYDTEKLSWVQGAKAPLPVDWFQENEWQRKIRVCGEDTDKEWNDVELKCETTALVAK